MNIKKTIPYRLLRQIYFFAKGLTPQKSASAAEYKQENKKDRENNTFYNTITDSAIKEFKNQKGIFNDFSLAESSVRAFLFHLLMQNKTSYHICEFGGGQSTIFWNILSNYIGVKVTTYEHDPNWAKFLHNQIKNPNIKINSCELMQIDEISRGNIFADPKGSKQIWTIKRSKVSTEQFEDPFLINGFYNVENNQFPEHKIDAIILDGPHGNGRSMAFPLFYDYIEEGTLILLDDYHHYPFLDDLNKLFEYQILEKRNYVHSNKGWVVLSILKQKI